MSKGRFNFGVVRGLYHKDFRVFGVNMEDSREITQHFHQMITTSLKSGMISSNNEHIEFPDVDIYPKGYSKEVATCMTAESASTTEWLAKQGLPMVLSWIIGTNEKKLKWNFIMKLRQNMDTI